MKKLIAFSFFLFVCSLSNICLSRTQCDVKTGADRLDILLPMLKNKRVGLVINQTSRLSNGRVLLDVLLDRKIRIAAVFTPEHGLSGHADAGESVNSGKDTKKGYVINSLYGKNFKPSPKQLAGIDVMVYDIQDVGTRFYTYISTLHYVMEACAENHKLLVVLDRPDPNDYVDGPVLNGKFSSFVGKDALPVVYGMTPGELAGMINGEHWLSGGVQCGLCVIGVLGWRHGQVYNLPVAPSPNLPNMKAVRLYPSLCFFEATGLSVGRGTLFPFQVVGGASPALGAFRFTPQSLVGAKNPPLKGKCCYGIDLRKYGVGLQVDLHFLLDFYRKVGKGSAFFKRPRFFDLLAGSDCLRRAICVGLSAERIRESWKKSLCDFRKRRALYILYPDYSL